MTERNFITVAGRILLLAPSFFIVSITRKLKLLLGYHSKMLFEEKYVILSGTIFMEETYQTQKGKTEIDLVLCNDGARGWSELSRKKLVDETE